MPSRPWHTGLGPWFDADLEGTAAAYSGDGSDYDIDPVSRLGRHVCWLALRRSRQHLNGMRRDAIAIFLLQPSPNVSSTIREPMLGDGGVEICGKIWFVNVTAQSGRSIDADCEDDGRMFEQVEGLGMGHVPAVVFNPKVKVPTVRIYKKGLSNDCQVESIEIVERKVDLGEIKRVINLMYEKQLCTPDAQVSGASMWANAKKFHAASNAEAIAQLQVKTALSSRLFDCEIRHEQKMRAGRTDIEVVQRLSDGTTLTPAEIEIKVLRERNKRGGKWTDSSNERWMQRGVRQAAAYRDDRKAKSGMLCCFDMRDGDRGELRTFAAIKPYADNLDISLHRHFLYNSAEAWRKAKYRS